MSETSLAATIQRHAADRPAQTAMGFLAADGITLQTVSYAQLDSAARVAAHHIRSERITDAPVLLLTRTDAHCVAALCGCLYAGVPFAPVPIPGRGSGPRRLTPFATALEANLVLAPLDTRHLNGALPDGKWLAYDNFPTPGEIALRQGPHDPAKPVLVQFTSGSTAEPRGVVLTNANIVANLEMLRTAFLVSDADRYASWLPLFHDMGLAMLLMPLYFGVPGALLSPMAFLRRPARWLETVSRVGATITGAPNFAYDLCTSRVTAEEASGLDLRQCRIAFCGAEPVRRTTMTAFSERFAPGGFAASSLYPCYGLAEAVTFVAGGFLSSAREAQDHEAVSCGRRAAGSTIVIVHPETGKQCVDGDVGEVWVAGPHVAAGYMNQPEESQAQFAATLPNHVGRTFLRTGDLGTMIEGELTITGRIKDIIIHRGENIHAVDVEAAVVVSHPDVSKVAAAFGCVIDGRECLVIVQELARGAVPPDPGALRQAAEDAVALLFGIRLHDHVVVRTGAIPKTTSGKVRRDEARRLYVAGLLGGMAAGRSDA